jgi:hypothetical protein
MLPVITIVPPLALIVPVLIRAPSSSVMDAETAEIRPLLSRLPSRARLPVFAVTMPEASLVQALPLSP